ncbi:MAG TPA: sn-glycerol-3-phosphate ABC transporter ATP-binding protein UgpC [Clostridia bacterium]|nr:sn-glycerol-3-phosphate ABC transporter ATP-binding protein UgpC [Clostridia bacterium]
MANVTLKNIKKVYDKNVVAVQEFSLDIADKEFVVLVGPSGCGKSTTLRMVAGLEEITSGEIYIGDTLVNDVPPKDRDIAMVFQNYALYPHMTVYENMAFALKLRKATKQEIDEKVKEAAEILGITELLQRKPKALSGGQRQRVAIGRAIVRHPQVFLMDEPLSNLDAKLRNQMRAELIKLRQRIDTTFIYVTHDQTEAMTLGDRIVIMKNGFIQQIGTPHEVFHEPANLFVAGFIGTPQMNFFPANLTVEGNRYVAELYGVKIPLPSDRQKVLELNKRMPGPVTLGVRPEHIRVVPEGAEHAIRAQVDVSEMMGSEVYLHVNVDGKDAVLRVPTGDLLDSYTFTPGRENFIHFAFSNTMMHLFDPETEQSLYTVCK